MSNKLNPIVVASVRMTTNQLSTPELVAIYQAATAGFDPKGVSGYEKAKALFTEVNGTRMHKDTLAVLDVIVSERLGVS